VRIGSHPAIAVAVRDREREALVHLDPVYGRFNHRASEPIEAGALVAYACPRCRTRLELPDRRCSECGAPVFAVEAGERGRVEWCTRQGCHGTRWEAADALGPRPSIELTVEDSGHGIAGTDLDRLFEPFFTTKGNRGLGLGLAVTWGIVEAHRGAIEVESEPGRGARFTVRLPLAVAGAAAPDAAATGGPAPPARIEPRAAGVAAAVPAPRSEPEPMKRGAA
jgi:hypothetical protein